MVYSNNGVVAENVFHVRKGSPYSAADLVALRNLFNTWHQTSWSTYHTAYATLFRIRSKALDTASSPLDDYYLPIPRPGTNSVSGVPGNVTFCIKLSTGLAGRSYRGRLYWIGMGINQFGASLNQINPATATALVTSLNNFVATLAAAGHTLGVASYRADKAWRAVGVFTPALNWVAVNYDLDSMRRRLTGRGI